MEGLRTVMVKLSGTAETPAHPQLEAALADAQRYLVQYGYEDTDTGLQLRLEYDGAALRELLQRAGQPLLTANRPRVLSWLVLNDGERRRFPTTDADAGLRAGLRDAFRRRGIPLQQPLYDLTDAMRLSPGAAWRQSSPALLGASARYGEVAVLTGRVAVLADGSCAGDWQFLESGQWVRRSVNAPSMDRFLSAGADLVAATLADRYAVVAGDSGTPRYRITVEGVDSFATYSDLRRLLAGVEVVQQVTPETLQGSRLVLQVDATADVDQLARIIELDRRLRRERALPAEGALYYRWED